MKASTSTSPRRGEAPEEDEEKEEEEHEPEVEAEEETPAEVAATGEAPSEEVDPRLEEPGDIGEEELEESEEPAEQEVPEKPAREHVTFDVDMSCGGCEQRVRNSLLDCQGVTNVETSVENQRVEVKYNPHAVEREELAEIIREKDFEVSELTPAP